MLKVDPFVIITSDPTIYIHVLRTRKFPLDERLKLCQDSWPVNLYVSIFNADQWKFCAWYLLYKNYARAQIFPFVLVPVSLLLTVVHWKYFFLL